MDLDNFAMSLDIGWFDERNATLAEMHELGGGKIPSRTHLHKVANSTEFWNFISTDVVKNLFKQNPNAGFELVGKLFIKYYTTLVLGKMITPPLKPKTIAIKKKKGSLHPSTPLVDTMQMLNALRFRIKDKS